MNLRTALGRLQSLVLRNRRDAELDEELRLHLELASAEFERQGMPADQARRAARLQLGGIDRTREQMRDAGGFPWLDSVAQDLRYAARMARRQPGFSAVVILSVALGIGANTAIFSLVDAVLLRPLAYRDPDRLAVVRVVIPDLVATYPTLPANGLGFVRWREQVDAFETLSAISPVTQTLSGAGDPTRVEAARVSANLFATLGTSLALGRDFRAEEDQDGRDGVVILDNGFWRRRLGGDLGVLGRTLTLDGRPYVVIGVLPADFRFPRGGQLGALVTLAPHTDVFRPLALNQQERTSGGDYDYAALARVKPGVSLAQADAQVNAVQAAIARDAGLPFQLAARLVPLQEQMVGHARRGLVVMATSVGTVLLLLCVNLANLLLARTADRQRESAIRSALGASRARVVRQLVIENVLLALVGGALGIAIAAGGLGVMASWLPVEVPRFDEVRLRLPIVGLAALLATAAGLLFSMFPALRLSTAPPHAALMASRRTMSDGVRGARTRGTLVAAEVALTTVLLVVAGLLMASFVRLLTIPRGFAHDGITLATLAPSPDTAGDRDRRLSVYDRLLAEAGRLPGVSAAALVSNPPLNGDAHVNSLSREHDTRPLTLRPAANFRYVSPGYFAAIGIRLVHGRGFDQTDRTRSVVVLNERAAASLWPGEDPIGRRIHQGDTDVPPQEVVGVVADTREVELRREPAMMGYLPYWGARVPASATLVLRTQADAAALSAPLRRAVAIVDPSLPVPDVRTMHDVVSRAIAPERFQMWLVVVFAASALLLATLGIYGVPAYAVSRRTQELGIRMALGAQPSELVRMVIREGLGPVAIGLGLGLAGALATGRFVAGLLFDVTPYDPATFGLVLLLVTSVALVASYVPARRATRIDPTAALRFE